VFSDASLTTNLQHHTLQLISELAAQAASRDAKTEVLMTATAAANAAIAASGVDARLVLDVDVDDDGDDDDYDDDTSDDDLVDVISEHKVDVMKKADHVMLVDGDGDDGSSEAMKAVDARAIAPRVGALQKAQAALLKQMDAIK
jgi:hypothetical protein